MTLDKILPTTLNKEEDFKYILELLDTKVSILSYNLYLLHKNLKKNKQINNEYLNNLYKSEYNTILGWLNASK